MTQNLAYYEKRKSRFWNKRGSSHKYILIKKYCILARKSHFSYVTLSNGFKVKFLLSVYLSVPGNVMFMTFQFCILKEQGSLWLKTKNILKKAVAAWLRGKEQWRAVLFAGFWCAMVSSKTDSIKRFSNFNF